MPDFDIKRTGRLKQAAFRTNFAAGMPFDDMCKVAAELGLYGFEYAAPDDATLKKYGLQCTCANAGISFPDGIIRPELHAALEKSVGNMIDQCAVNKVPNIVVVGGQRKGMSYEQGADNAVAFYNRIKSHLEDKNVTTVMEVMNTRNDDPQLGRTDQICDHIDWAVNVCKRVNSPNVKVLFDIYHVQIMDGDVVRHIRDNIQWIGHFHTGGVPGRHELDDTQELNYKYIAQEIAKLNFTGFVAHEYRPAPGRDPIASMKQSIEIMRV